MEKVLGELFLLTDQLVAGKPVMSIGLGVPGLVEAAMVYDVMNIPSWKELPLKKFMEDRYSLPVYINNDANCFALGEFYFGRGAGCDSMIGLTIGTGLGAGIILNKKLYTGRNGGAGEFGMADYLDHCYEYYASGQFFSNVYHTKGEDVFAAALDGDAHAVKMYEEMGTHLGNAIKMMLYSLDVELFVLGGSVRAAHQWFSANMWKQVNSFAFRNALKHLRIEVSGLENSGILGAALLYQHFHKT
jgi:glucokinase